MHGVMLFQGISNKIEEGGIELEVSDFLNELFCFPYVH